MTQPHLERKFGLLQATALNMTNMIGVGPFITIPALMSALNGPQSMLGWFLALLITIPDGMIWAELASSMPRSGGTYSYLREAFGPQKWGRLMAFLFIWQFILSGPLEIASGFVGLNQYLSYLLPDLNAAITPIVIGAICLILLYRRIDSIGKITVTLWIGTLLTTGAVILTGIFNFNSSIAFDFPPDAFDMKGDSFGFTIGFLSGLGTAARVGIYDYLGYYDVCYIGDEVKNPGKTIARSILLSLVAVAAIYIGINLSIIGVISWREFVPETSPPAPVVSMMMERVHGANVANILTVMVLWTAFGSIFALLLGYSRIPYAAAVDGNFFSVFGRLHPKGFPHLSLIFIIGISVACAYLPLMQIIDMLLITRILVQFIGQIAAVWWLRKTRPEMERPYKMWLYPLPCLAALAGWVFVFLTYSWKTQLYGLGVLALGLAAFAIWSAVTRRWPFASTEKSNDL